MGREVGFDWRSWLRLGAKRKQLGRAVGTRWKRKNVPQLEKYRDTSAGEGEDCQNCELLTRAAQLQILSKRGL